jgi:hypothetical protein
MEGTWTDPLRRLELKKGFFDRFDNGPACAGFAPQQLLSVEVVPMSAQDVPALRGGCREGLGRAGTVASWFPYSLRGSK